MGRYYAYSESEGSSIFRLISLMFSNVQKNKPLSLNGQSIYRTDICLNAQDASNICEIITLAVQLKNYYSQLSEDIFTAHHNISNMHIDNQVLRHGAPHSLRIHSIYFQTSASEKEFAEYCASLAEIIAGMLTDMQQVKIYDSVEEGANLTLTLQYPEYGEDTEVVTSKFMLCRALEHYLAFHNIAHHDVSGEGNEMIIKTDAIKFNACLAHEVEMKDYKPAKPAEPVGTTIMGFLASQPIKSVDVSLSAGN